MPREPWRFLRGVGFYDHWEQVFLALSFERSFSFGSYRLPGAEWHHLRPNSDADAWESVAIADSQSIAYADSYTHAYAHTSSDPADQH